MKVSIITTIYKAEKDLPRLLDSMMAQESDELEFFLIDNGSPDNCGEICKEYVKKDKRFKVCTLKENIGYIRARNYGIEHCDADYIGFCDSDDYLEIGGYDIAIKKIKETSCDLYITAYNTVSENSKLINKIPYNIGLYEGNDIYDRILPQAFGSIDGKPALHGFAWKQIFKKSIIIDNKFSFMPELQPYEDQIFNIDVIKMCNRIYIDDNIIYNYVVNTQSITAKLVANFDAEAEWNRIKIFWHEKKKRIISFQHSVALSNQIVAFIYSMLLNMTKQQNKSVKTLVSEMNKNVEKDVIQEMLLNSSDALDKKLLFVKKCLLKQKYNQLFITIRLLLKIK